MKYYAVKYFDGKKTTFGEPNPRTGMHSIACDIECFKCKHTRDEWVKKSIKRESIKYSQLRALCRGESIEAFKRFLACIDDWPV